MVSDLLRRRSALELTFKTVSKCHMSHIHTCPLLFLPLAGTQGPTHPCQEHSQLEEQCKQRTAGTEELPRGAETTPSREASVECSLRTELMDLASGRRTKKWGPGLSRSCTEGL